MLLVVSSALIPLPTLSAATGLSTSTSALVLVGATVAFYIAVRATADAARSRPVLAVVLSIVLPTAAAALLAAAAGRPGAGFATVYASAAAMLTLVLGLGLVTPADKGVAQRKLPDPAPTAAALLPVVVAVLLSGFGSTFGLLDTILLGIVGGAALVPMWPTLKAKSVEPEIARPLRAVQIGLAVLLATAAALLVSVGSSQIDSRIGRDSLAIAATLLAAPMIALPVVGLITAQAAEGRRNECIAALASAASILLGLILPLTALVAIVRQASFDGVPVPLRLWRVDSVVLAVAAVLLLPTALRRWKPAGWEGLGLIGLFVAYLVVSVLSSR